MQPQRSNPASLGKYRHLILRPALLLLLLGYATMPAAAAELVRITGATLIESASNDGDSFRVNAAGRELHLRLYYVDCPETSAYGGNSGLERIREQQRHFGLEEMRAVLDFGKQAAERTRQALSRPFTIHTTYARAPGGSASGRYYAFVETHDGRDLGHLLVEQGFARIHGKTRPSPHGTPSEIVLAELQDARAIAMLKRSGIWRDTNAEILAELRKLQRADDQEMAELRKTISPKRTQEDPPLDPNTASNEQLQTIPGIGPVTAAKIIASRPYRSVRDLLKIDGIGEKTLLKIAPHLVVGGDGGGDAGKE